MQFLSFIMNSLINLITLYTRFPHSVSHRYESVHLTTSSRVFSYTVNSFEHLGTIDGIIIDTEYCSVFGSLPSLSTLSSGQSVAVVLVRTLTRRALAPGLGGSDRSSAWRLHSVVCDAFDERFMVEPAEFLPDADTACAELLTRASRATLRPMHMAVARSCRGVRPAMDLAAVNLRVFETLTRETFDFSSKEGVLAFAAKRFLLPPLLPASSSHPVQQHCESSREKVKCAFFQPHAGVAGVESVYAHEAWSVPLRAWFVCPLLGREQNSEWATYEAPSGNQRALFHTMNIGPAVAGWPVEAEEILDRIRSLTFDLQHICGVTKRLENSSSAAVVRRRRLLWGLRPAVVSVVAKWGSRLNFRGSVMERRFEFESLRCVGEREEFGIEMLSEEDKAFVRGLEGEIVVTQGRKVLNEFPFVDVAGFCYRTRSRVRRGAD